MTVKENSKEAKPLDVKPAEGVSFYTPAQIPPAGTAIAGKDGKVPKLFTPIKIRGVEMQNRIWVSPMCQYSAHEGFHTPWHDTHLGGILQRGPGLTMIEATAVSPNGRITPGDSGIWLDAHMAGLKKHVEFAHSQNVKIGIQIAHAGRKASMVPPWLSFGAVAEKEAGGWPDDVVGTDSEPFSEDYCKPREMSLAEIDQLREDFKTAIARAIKVGFDVIELHYAHGYLLSTFLAPSSNKRTDKYGGSFENRIRLPLEIIDDARSIMPKDMPLYVRISASDWLDTNPDYKGEVWDIKQSVEFAKLLPDHGVDVIDVSSGGIHSAQKITGGPAYQANFAKEIKKAVGDRLLVSAVGGIKSGKQAEEIISGSDKEGDEPVDLVAAGRAFQKNPGLVWAWADELQTNIVVANQIGWGFSGRGSRKDS